MIVFGEVAETVEFMALLHFFCLPFAARITCVAPGYKNSCGSSDKDLGFLRWFLLFTYALFKLLSKHLVLEQIFIVTSCLGLFIKKSAKSVISEEGRYVSKITRSS